MREHWRQNSEICTHAGEHAVQRAISLEKEKPCEPLPSEAQSQQGSEGRYHCSRWSVLPRRERVSKDTVTVMRQPETHLDSLLSNSYKNIENAVSPELFSYYLFSAHPVLFHYLFPTLAGWHSHVCCVSVHVHACPCLDVRVFNSQTNFSLKPFRTWKVSRRNEVAQV